jgi:hypothetical protein
MVALSCVIVSFVVVMCICLLFVVPYFINAATCLTAHLQCNNNNLVIVTLLQDVSVFVAN